MPRLIPLLTATEIRTLGDAQLLNSETWAKDTRVSVIEHSAPIFSIGEQLAGVYGPYRGASLLWVPQYNVPFGYRGKLLVTIHDLCQLAHPETLSNWLQRSYARMLLKSVAKRASTIFCVSGFTADEVEQRLNVERSRIVVTYPEIGNTSCEAGPNQAEAQDLPYLLAVGNVKKHKNLGALISAFAIVRDRIPHNLVIVGKKDGFLNSDETLCAESVLLHGRVQFVGEISDEQLTSLYRNADGLMFPSIYEGFGYPLVEAMAQRCPVACSNIASLPEVAADAALLFNPFDVEDIARAICRIATDQRLRIDLRERGVDRLQAFRYGACAEQTANVMNRLLAE